VVGVGEGVEAGCHLVVGDEGWRLVGDGLWVGVDSGGRGDRGYCLG